MTTGREYLRVSLDRSGREKSISEQQDDNRAHWPNLTFGVPYRDVGSASRHSRKARNGFDELINDLKADRFGADVLVLWESSRGSRKVGEWVELIELAESRHVKFAVTTHGRIYDPANARDRKSLIDDASDSEYESSKISARVRRDAAALAAAGHPHGQVRFGYRRRYDPETRKLVGDELDPTEAPTIAELFERLEAGHALRAISVDFARRGITSRSGKRLSPQYLRELAINPAYAGLRRHVPGRAGGSVKPGEGHLYPAEWPAIVPMTRWRAVQRILNEPSRRTNTGKNVRRGGGRYFLSMISRCDPCGSVLAAARDNRDARPPFYRCQSRGCVQIDMAGLDKLAQMTILAYLADPANRQPDRTSDAELSKIDDDIAAIKGELEDLADQVGRGEVSASLAARAEPGILERLRAAEARRDELTTPAILRDLLGPDADVPARWKLMPMSARREVARMVFVPAYIGELRVQKAPYRGADADERVIFRRD